MDPITRREALTSGTAAILARVGAPGRGRTGGEGRHERSTQAVRVPVVLRQDPDAGVLQGRRRQWA